jgi:FkbM family methyltransferase
MQKPTVIWPGEFPEASLIAWAKQLIKGDFVDIGAHVGTYSLSYAPHCGKVYAFEPQRMTFYRLCAGIIMNRCTNVYAHNVALVGPDSPITMELKIISDDGGGSSVMSLPTNKQPLGTERVECRTLDSYELINVGLIKIDVEGAELEVLKGAKKTLARCHPKLLVEVWNDDWYAQQRKDLDVFLKSEGYKWQPVLGYPHMWICEPKP